MVVSTRGRSKRTLPVNATSESPPTVAATVTLSSPDTSEENHTPPARTAAGFHYGSLGSSNDSKSSFESPRVFLEEPTPARPRVRFASGDLFEQERGHGRIIGDGSPITRNHEIVT